MNGTRTVKISSPGCTKGMLRNVAPDSSVSRCRPVKILCHRPAYCATFCCWNIVSLTDSVLFRFRADMWARVAEEMAMPWRAVEAMHWQMGEHEMAKRAGVTPFSLTNPAGGLDPTLLPPRPPLRHAGPPPRPMRRGSMPPETSLQGPQQLPSLAELTAGLPAFSAPPYHTSDPFHHLYNHSRGRNSHFR